MDHADLISGARYLIRRSELKPKQADLRRAQSAAYYALFHVLARCGSDSLVGGQGSERSKHAWRQAYRALEHGHAKTQCKQSSVIKKFPSEVEDFANLFVLMQGRRHRADYDPHYRTTRSEVTADLDAVKAVIDQFMTVQPKDKRVFATWVLLKSRPYD